MDVNPLTRKCIELQKEIDGLQQSGKQVANELQWYSSIGPRALAEDLGKNEAAAEKLQSEILALEKEIQENAARLGETESAMGTLTRESTEIKRQIDGLQKNEKQIADELLWYSSIDPRALDKDLRENEAMAEKLQSEILAVDKEIQENAARLGEIKPAIGTLFNPFNWFAMDQVALRTKKKELVKIGKQKAAQRQSNVKGLEDTLARIAKVKSDLQRYDTFDFPRLQSDVHQISQAIASKQEELAIVADRIRRDRDMLAQLHEIGNQKAAKWKSNVKELEIRAQMAKVKSDLQRYGTIDLPRRQSDVQQIQQSIARKKEELAKVAYRKRGVDEVLAPLMQTMLNLESRKRSTESDLEAAHYFSRQLSFAEGQDHESRNKRRMIHEECKLKCGEGDPRKIIGERQKLERDYDKIEQRVKEILQWAARKIDTIVIDGNNLCNEGDNTFIGLSAIEALVRLLAQISSVVVVFDPGIRGMLNIDVSGIQRRFGSHAKVHIVARNRKADETVLDLASASEDVYVLSNDGFDDFKEKPVMRDGRVIRAEIVNGNILVHELLLKAAYLAEKQELRQ